MTAQEMNEQRMLQQDGVTTGNDCYISGDFNVCPASANFQFGGEGDVSRLEASIKCPFDAVAQSDFRDASQKGLCECEATIQNLNLTDSTAAPINCECFICPDQANQFGVAYTCDVPITGPCTTFNCGGICNGDLNFIDGAATRPPTAPPQPVSNENSGAFGINPAMGTTVLLVLSMFRMFR